MPLAEKYGIDDRIVEITNRISYYHSLTTLQQSDALFIPGSDDSAYTASKIYPYLLTGKPLLAIFNPESPAIDVLKDYGVTQVYDYEHISRQSITDFLKQIINGNFQTIAYNPETINKYSAKQITFQQCVLFNQVIDS